MRSAKISRQTAETKIDLTLSLDGTGEGKIETGCGFFDHMLTLFKAHSRFDLSVTCEGDSYVDYHHSVEDIGICLGKALKEAVGDKRGIRRYGNFVLPMDEALIAVTLDLSGRAYLAEDIDIKASKVGDFDTELCKEFLLALSREGGITLHIRQIRGENSHHIIEAIFKGLARALKEAVSVDPELKGAMPSTKGMLE